VGSVKGDTRTHKDLEWFRPSERNTLHPLFCIASEDPGVQSLRKLVCVLPEKGLSHSRVRQA
jgi:hypothetical protein